MRNKQVPLRRAFRRPLGDERAREQQARGLEIRARAARRHRLWQLLVDIAHSLCVNAVMPDVDDPLVEAHPLPDTDVDFPVSAVEFWATWRIGVERDPVVGSMTVHAVSDSDEEDNIE
jgi:hypothetical protein